MNLASVQLDSLEKSNDDHETLAARLKLDGYMTKVCTMLSHTRPSCTHTLRLAGHNVRV